MFDVLNAACFAEMSTEQCARFCNGHGTCSTAHPGTCACDAQWYSVHTPHSHYSLQPRVRVSCLALWAPLTQRHLLRVGRRHHSQPMMLTYRSGLQCEVSTVPEECIKGEWSAWSTCSTPCGIGTQSRSAAYVPATPNTVCQAQAVMQERQCNTHPCGTTIVHHNTHTQTHHMILTALYLHCCHPPLAGDVGCSGCAAESAGPCRAPHNNVCYSFYAGTTVCPAGTAACSTLHMPLPLSHSLRSPALAAHHRIGASGNQCTDCAAGTEGPCHHLADETCVPYGGTTMAGTGQCAAGTVSCSEAPVPDGFCHGCWPGTSGRCQQANSVCWALLPSGELHNPLCVCAREKYASLTRIAPQVSARSGLHNAAPAPRLERCPRWRPSMWSCTV